MRTVELTPRLRSVAELVPRGARFADVGTDHAYLPVWLLQQGRITGAVASDLRPGPLERARGTAEKYGLTGRMDFRLCDGLSGIRWTTLSSAFGASWHSNLHLAMSA